MPINRTTLNELFGLSLNSDDAVAAFLQARAEPIRTIRTSADVVISKIGRELYEKFFRGYTRKQWGLHKWLIGQVSTKTSISYEYPCAEGEPYYPIPTQRNYELYDKYRTLCLETGVELVGRLAAYRYYNMDQVVGQALSAYRRMAKFQKQLSSALRHNKGALANAAE